jgi:hypothetical protein
MIKYELKKNNVITNRWLSSFADEAYWEPSFGKKAGWYQLTELTQEELSTEIERREVESSSQVLIEVRIPNQYQVIIEDISEQIEAEKALEKSKLALSLGADLVAQVRLINIQKDMDAQTYLSLIQDQSLAAIERLLWVGSFETAKAFIQGYEGPFYTSEEKLSIINLIDSAILKTI